MPAHGYLMFMVRASVPHRPHELYRLSEAGPQGVDVLGQVFHHLKALGEHYHAVDRQAEGYRVRELAVRGRTVWVKINRGPAAIPGETYHLDLNTSTTTTDRQAQLSELRALFVMPKNSYYGLLFVERIGRRNLRDLLTQVAIRPTVSTSAAQIRIEAFAELSDWQRELADMQVLRVSESLRKKSSGDDASSVSDTLVTVSAEGGGIHEVSSKIKDFFESRIHRRDERDGLIEQTSALGEDRRAAEADGTTFQDEVEYLAIREQLKRLNAPTAYDDSLEEVVDTVLEIDRDTLEHQRWEFALGEDRPQRNIIIERDTLPQFIYELGNRHHDRSLRDTWMAHAESVLTKLGVTLPAGWNANPPNVRRKTIKKSATTATKKAIKKTGKKGSA